MARRWGDPVRLITETELLFPRIAVAIALLETGGFQARSMMKSHNWFGFRKNGRGFQKRIRKGYGEYASAQMMLADYQAWETDVCLKYGIKNEDQFRRWICRHYAADPDYPIKLAINLAEVNKTWQ